MIIVLIVCLSMSVNFVSLDLLEFGVVEVVLYNVWFVIWMIFVFFVGMVGLDVYVNVVKIVKMKIVIVMEFVKVGVMVYIMGNVVIFFVF